MDRKTHFDELLEDVMQEQMAGVTFPNGMEQRLLARLAQERPVSTQRFAFSESIRMPSDRRSLWMALGVHATAILLIAVAVAAKVQIMAPAKPLTANVDLRVPLPPPMSRVSTLGGGGGQHQLSPAAEGRLPKVAPDQIVPPMAPPTIPPKLAVEPTVVMQPDLKIAENNMPNLGLPNSNLHGVSLGSGSGTGIGSGDGPGVGAGSGGGNGGGVMHVGGLIRKPQVLRQVDPEFSEEARRAKFSGNVEVYLIIDEQGNPSHVRVVRGVGMGLDEKAVEAVRQYKFKPATLNGKPVKVDLSIDVDFHIY